MHLKTHAPFRSDSPVRDRSSDRNLFQPSRALSWLGAWMFVITGILSVSLSPFALASSLVDVGYSTLQSELDARTPTGAGVRVAQVEAPTNDTSGGAAPIFMPNPSDAQFAGKVLTAQNGNASGTFSDHATAVGRLFYGNTSSIAPGLTQIDAYDAVNWFTSLSNASGTTTTGPNRVTNHSWVGTGDTPSETGQILRMVDRQVHINESIQVVGLANGSSDSPLLGSAYNVISVGRTDGGHQQRTVSVAGDSLYGTARAAALLVAPESTTSSATPVVAAAAALLVQTGHGAGLSLSEGSTTISGVGTIYNAERSETIKATLSAGADRETSNTGTTTNITDYRSAGHETANGLDDRYGAGQVNIYNSYHILAGGEQQSLQSGGGDIGSRGFDYGTIGRVGGIQGAASYFFNATSEVTLFASLAWNLSLSNDAQLTSQLYNLDVSLFDVTNNRLVASSISPLDNTENLFFNLLVGNRYEMRVTTNESTDFSGDYALAWRMDPSSSPVPLPAAVWLFGSGMAGLAAIAHRRMQRPFTA
ncbi:MAG: VPLPA-CTERM sorting domain-containing protein [Nitrospira sp.]|nr:MAG: VPLPA-CTERM sorting domain-containing protein [Nitrospira sp.]